MTSSPFNNDVLNVADHLTANAALTPDKRAVVWPTGRDRTGRRSYAHWTFSQLEREADRLAHGLDRVGIRRGVRTILMVRPGPEFFALVFAMFKVAAVPVVVDPGMGLDRMLSCLEQSRPEAFIGIPPAQAMRTLFRRHFRSVKTRITVGRRWFWGGPTLDDVRLESHKPYPAVQPGPDETAAVLFTTGSTGPAKGAVYSHGNFAAQIRQIRATWDITPDEIDLPTFPLFALFDPALGMTAVIPDMDPTKPALVNPLNIAEPIQDHGVTNMFASPALLNRVGRWGEKRGLRLPSLKRVVSAGAPVPAATIARFSGLLAGEAEVHTPYGATEAVPIISIAGREIIGETRALTDQGLGICVGRPLTGLDIRIIEISDEPIEAWSDDLEIEDGRIGEITVKGDLVTQGYFENPAADAASKIRDGDRLRHRMGDLGRQDEKGRIWFCGRKNHRVVTEDGTLFTIPTEAVFNNHPQVFRSALVGVGRPPRQRAVIIIELENDPGPAGREKLKRELLRLAQAHEKTRAVKSLLFHPSFPVDIRHNSKIFREKLAVWAAEQPGLDRADNPKEVLK